MAMFASADSYVLPKQWLPKMHSTGPRTLPFCGRQGMRVELHTAGLEEDDEEGDGGEEGRLQHQMYTRPRSGVLFAPRHFEVRALVQSQVQGHRPTPLLVEVGRKQWPQTMPSKTLCGRQAACHCESFACLTSNLPGRQTFIHPALESLRL